MKITITRFPYEAQLSGLEWHTIDLARQLRERGHAVSFVGSCPVLTKELRTRGFPVDETWIGVAPVSKLALFVFPFLLPWTIFQCIRMARKTKLEGVSIFYMLTLLEKLVLTPIALTMGFSVVWSEHERLGRWLFGNPLFLFYKLWSRRVRLITNSEDGRKLFEKYGILATHILNGTDLSTFAPRKHQPIGRTKRIGTIARFYADKGISDFIASAKILNARHPEARFSIVGEGPLRERLEHEITENGLAHVVRMLGFLPREKIVEFLHGLDVFVLPSALHDPFGFVAAEAMACGVPTVVTDACGILHWAKAGEHVAVCKAQDPHDMAEVISGLLSQPERAKTLAQAGQEHARTHFGLDEMVTKYENVFRVH